MEGGEVSKIEDPSRRVSFARTKEEAHEAWQEAPNLAEDAPGT